MFKFFNEIYQSFQHQDTAKYCSGGLHPDYRKELTNQQAITQLPIPRFLHVPLHQNLGQPSSPCVQIGQLVLKGEVIGSSTDSFSAPVHAPTSGIVVAIEHQPVCHPSGMTMLCITIEADGRDQWLPTLQGVADPLHCAPDILRDKIRAAGIVGLGGAAFPSHMKLSPPSGAKIHLLLANGAECEPYLTCDDRLMQESAAEIVEGLQIMLHILQSNKCLIGIEDNKPDAIRAMEKATQSIPNMRVQSVPSRYPQGGEKQLIETMTGVQVPSGKLPLDVGIVVHNVATALAVREAVLFGRPLISRVVTVAGKGIANGVNAHCLIGTPVRALLDHVGGVKTSTKRLVMGGPMMGIQFSDLNVPVVKATSGILALTEAEIRDHEEKACIRCGRCVQACPMHLVPCEMAWSTKNEQFDKLSELSLFDCIECGSCSYICPSNIPLVQYFRYGKWQIRAENVVSQRLELDKVRINAKNERTERARIEKERQKEAMKAAMQARKKAAAQETESV
ncbi:MAG: electron transport complex subunit RsxC [Magnetococcales bacterium]|nr:electron transport complex subunit RsxC [Magnetococcales bacterium]MBF0116287.1 electron transport complex subunit RsxC [Magnetococcales bacterium]